ncbi:TrmH family RNA methyltransferase [Lachnobacterium bovis]|uniref:TrmH family RNA methyltransferase n=1 Tax=Lachnobacterium bovis TaxID=140626 RepID=UPI0003B39540|nr:RNA methyltransferase [Lachnobacterium bovis]
MITSSSNQQVKKLIALYKKSKERKKENVFIVEGIKMFKEAPSDWVKQVYVSEDFYNDIEKRSLYENYQYEVLSNSVFKSVCDTITPQGIIALIKIPKYTLEDMLDGDKTQLLILESVQDPGNLGTMVRSGEGAGTTGIIMNKTTVDIFNTKTIRSTMGSIYRMPFIIVDDLRETIKELKEKNVSLFAAHLKGKQAYDEKDYTKACGFFIGNEGNGLSDEIANLADDYIIIPMQGDVESLNAAISATLLMYEANRQRRKK